MFKLESQSVKLNSSLLLSFFCFSWLFPPSDDGSPRKVCTTVHFKSFPNPAACWVPFFISLFRPSSSIIDGSRGKHQQPSGWPVWFTFAGDRLPPAAPSAPVVLVPCQATPCKSRCGNDRSWLWATHDRCLPCRQQYHHQQ